MFKVKLPAEYSNAGKIKRDIIYCTLNING